MSYSTRHELSIRPDFPRDHDLVSGARVTPLKNESSLSGCRLHSAPPLRRDRVSSRREHLPSDSNSINYSTENTNFRVELRSGRCGIEESAFLAPLVIHVPRSCNGVRAYPWFCDFLNSLISPDDHLNSFVGDDTLVSHTIVVTRTACVSRELKLSANSNVIKKWNECPLPF